MESGDGLQFHSTDHIREFLGTAVGGLDLPAELCDLASRYKDSPVVPYLALKNVWSELPPDSRPSFRSLLSGATIAIESPKPREKSKELKERLEKLQELADQKAYRELVKDVVSDREEVVSFSTYKDQLGFGLHVIVTMFTGFLVGFALFRSQFPQNSVLRVVGGMVGLFAAMILETTLFIVRDYQFQNPSKFKRKSTSNRSSDLGSKKRQ